MDEQLLQRIRELTADFIIRPGQDSDADAVAFQELFNSTYDRKMPLPYYHWQFFDAPIPSVSLFVEHNGRLAAINGLRVVRCRGALQGTVGVVVDTIVAPEYRLTGVMGRLEFEIEAAAIEQGCLGLFGSPNDRAYYPRIKNLGWTAMPDVATWSASSSTGDETAGGVDFEKVPAFGADVNDVCSEFVRRHPSLIVLGGEQRYLNWRFARNPWYDYDLFLVRRRSVAVGYLVLKVFRDPVSGRALGDIVDLLWSDDEPETLRAMLQFARMHFRGQDVQNVGLWMQPNTLLYEVGQELGFQATIQVRHFCCRPTDASARSMADANRWYLSMASSEIF